MIFVGDIHGKIDSFKYLMEYYYNIENQTILQVGDFGIGFIGKNKIDELNNTLKKTNNQLLVMRGNHDNPIDFTNNQIMSNIKLLKDYTLIEEDNTKYFCIGGGISLDRKGRNEFKTYWKNEVIKVQKIKEKIDVLITHVPLVKVFNHHLNPEIIEYWLKIDKKLENDLKKEQQILEKFDKLDFKYWVSGHLHISKQEEYNNKIHRTLTELEFWEIKDEV